jgi:hypothetical protein
MEMEEVAQKMDKHLSSMDEQMSLIREISKDMGELLEIIENVPEKIGQLKDLVSRHCILLNNKIMLYEFDSMKMKFLIKNHIRHRMDVPSTFSKGTQTIDLTLDEEDQKKKEPFSFKPHSERTSSFENIIQRIPFLEDPVEKQRSKMRELYTLSQTDTRYIDFTGIYPRLNYLQGTDPKEIRYWYDFGAINSIYLSSPNFPETAELPRWIGDGVKSCYFNNSTITPKDILVLKFFSAGPDFHNDRYYPAYHFIEIQKCQSFSCTFETTKKDFYNFNENDIRYRRAIGIKIVLQTMEASFKKEFRTYGGDSKSSPCMISPARRSPESAKRYLKMKIDLLDTGYIQSSPQAQERICRYREHKINTCSACSKQKDKMIIDSPKGSQGSGD